MNKRIFRLKRGKFDDIKDFRPPLTLGEPCIDTDSGTLKFGDGINIWIDLPNAADDPPTNDKIHYQILMWLAANYGTGFRRVVAQRLSNYQSHEQFEALVDKFMELAQSMNLEEDKNGETKDNI